MMFDPMDLWCPPKSPSPYFEYDEADRAWMQPLGLCGEICAATACLNNSSFDKPWDTVEDLKRLVAEARAEKKKYDAEMAEDIAKVQPCCRCGYKAQAWPERNMLMLCKHQIDALKQHSMSYPQPAYPSSISTFCGLGIVEADACEHFRMLDYMDMFNPNLKWNPPLYQFGVNNHVRVYP